MVGLTFCGESFQHRGPAWLAYRPAESLNTDNFCVTVTHVSLPVGRGRPKKYNNFVEECKQRTGIISINNKDNLCLPRALITAIAKIENDVNYEKIRRDVNKQQLTKAQELVKQANVIIPVLGCGVTELKQFQSHLNNYKIVVYEYGGGGRDVIFEGSNHGKRINLLHYDDHFNVITSLTAAFCSSYYCEECNIPYHVKNDHRCSRICPCCQQLPQCRSNGNNILCKDCNRLFRSPICLENHKASGSKSKSICDEVKKCLSCLKTYKSNRQHICGESFCKTCNIHVSQGHLCFIQKDDKEPPLSNFIYVFYDLETRQEKKISENERLHEPNLCVLSQRCDSCIDESKLLFCQKCKFRNSLNYFPMALSELPKAFDLPSNFKKGYFPYKFNTIKNANYVGLLPAIEYYGANSMKPKERDIFLQWHENHKNDVFNMQRDIIEYCIYDVVILREACLKFRKLFITECNVEPFLEATTIASACNLVFRRNFLKSNTIGLIPKNGYRYADNQSKQAIQWLVFEEENRKINIQHAAKEREAIVAGVKVDGYCQETNQVFEFYGCYFHGHPSCLPHKRDKPLYDDLNDTLNHRYARTIEKSSRLRNLGYEVVEMWACDFESLLSTKQKEHLKNHPLVNCTPLYPRDAFYGGRTGNTFSYYKCKNAEKINYIDVCSLYPYVCKYGKFPIGHPKIHIGNTKCYSLNLQNINGLIKCKILPPERLYHPVLPLKQNNKLMFTLCRLCSEQRNQNKFCTHSNDERALTGTWVIDEVIKALEKNYRILETYEIWEYDVSQYNKLKNAEGLFSKMMDKFLKIKQEASGWPSKCCTKDQKEKYIEDFLQNEDIQLEYEKILNNPGLRSFAKLMLNSFWGKFGQRENLQKTNIINEPFELYEMLTNAAIEVCHILPINERNIVINWQYKEEVTESLSTVNVSIAAFTTAQARLKLYTYLEKLDNRVLYYDTDSIFYISREGEYEPHTGEFIGDMTNELESYGQGSYVTEFVSGGPKNYAYKVFSTKDNSEKVVCKVKGIRLNYDASHKINFETMKEAVLNLNNFENISILSDNIRRTKEHELITVSETKTYQPKSEKRRFLPDYSSLPFGYKRRKITQ
ncbi:uncharacterized protein LOC129618958 [Condylostylus longicornis]|uniref:uncharacterized protein LOC129618958 n=1 Tax=Condylostylus longicornis TaxID=2530218 RepID=UPI00244DC752|nr:uncharacterized protein LOC129618958 [Condylostylus longicornis]